jgi:steroid 5-alpha reductase family enzyme
MFKGKAVSLLLVTAVYVLAFGAASLVFHFLKDVLPPLSGLFIADTTATAVVYLFYLIFKNASVYDPYWSVQPLLLLTGFYLGCGLPFRAIHLWVVVPLVFWAVRLTVNWAMGFDNLAWQDWRYRDIIKNYPKYEKPLIFFGIMYMPTCLVFMGTIPLWCLLNTADSRAGEWIPVCLGGIIVLLGAVLELIADTQMKRYKADPNRGPCIRGGIWKYSRHPNYLGELLVWTGLFIAGLQNFRLISLPGVLGIMALFIAISIPMMEKHLLAKTPLYRDYRRDVPMLLPFLKLQRGPVRGLP